MRRLRRRSQKIRICTFILFFLTALGVVFGIGTYMKKKPPALQGKLIYHSYTSYEAMDSELFLYDFETGQLDCISKDWNHLKHPMNAHFSPDGKQFTFMAISETNSWDIFLCGLDQEPQPVNLTPGSADRDEDPKFSPNGQKIVFKRNDQLAELDLESKIVTMLLPDKAACSMPFYSADGSKIVFSLGIGGNSSIAVLDLKTKEFQILYDRAGVQDYYPVSADAESFYYTTGFSTKRSFDQVYRGYWDGRTPVQLPFNCSIGDYSDAYPVNSEWAILSSTRLCGRGAYDLYLANTKSGKVISLSKYNRHVNTGKNELGPCIFLEDTS